MSNVRFAFVLHNHQPVGNFDGVFEAAFQESYLPFLEVIEEFEDIPISLHTSGSLLEWLVAHKPEYIDRVRELVGRGQVEILGGGFYEPIMTMIPSRDRQGQIRGYSDYLEHLFEQKIRGMWIPERVWEASLVSDIVSSEIEFTVLDDFHFRKAGVPPETLTGYFTTEDDGSVLGVFPGSEPMRYMIPFHEIDHVLGHLRHVGEQRDDALVVFADDGEKFGSWPGTYDHVYKYGWIRRFLEALRENRDWLTPCTLGQAFDELEPRGGVYLPAASYREMTEWALPTDRRPEYEQLRTELEHSGRGDQANDFLHGGFWRNFKAKYPETRDMYARMMEVSRRLNDICVRNPSALADHRLYEARRELFRGQCNCPYWHGSFGGLYLPHLRGAVYGHLINADNQLDAFERGARAEYAEVAAADFNFDGKPEVRLFSDRLVAMFTPHDGGHLYGLDVRAIATALGAAVARRPEPYHQKIREGLSAHSGDGLQAKQEGLDRCLIYDDHQRHSLIERFLEAPVDADHLRLGEFQELGEFSTGDYRYATSRSGESVLLTMSHTGRLGARSVTVGKTITLTAGSSDLAIRYRLSDLPLERPAHFAVEFNIAALAGGADDRYYRDAQGTRLGRLDEHVDLDATLGIDLVDEWLGIEAMIRGSESARVAAYPVQSVSQSEGGYELVHQAACVVPTWTIPAGTGEWEVELVMTFDVSRAEKSGRIDSLDAQPSSATT
ncbi:alpha-amylase/4-alpha-glucanotransferase domain-containing protein [Planctomycetes bacterium Pan216]